MQEDKNAPKPSGDKKSSLDLSELQNFSFGPDWTSGSKGSSGGKPREHFKERNTTDSGGERGGGARRPRRPSNFRRDSSANQGEGNEQPQREGGRREFRRDDRRERRPQRDQFFKPTVEVSFYPEDAPFKALTTAIRNSLRTYQLFELANLILEKNDRFVVIVKPKAKPDEENPLLYTAVPDGAPFESEDEAVAYVFKNHLDKFFDTEEIEVEAPKGAFTQINRCGMTGDLLGPPNYHRYQQLLSDHHANRLSHVPYDVFERKIESVRDDEVVQQWLDKMKKQTRYTWKGAFTGEKQPVFEAAEAARLYILTHHRDKIVQATATARFGGKVIEQLPLGGTIRRSVEHELERQRKFPLDTANNLRGRLRRLKFTIYKKGSKGISFVSSIKRKFREEGQAFASSIQALIEFIEKHPSIKVTELPSKYLGFDPKELAEGETLAEDKQKVLTQFKRDLHWLVSEGYVVEYGDTSLLALPVKSNENAQGSQDDDSDSESSSEDEIVSELKPTEPDPVEEIEKEKKSAEPAPEPKAEETAAVAETSTVEENVTEEKAVDAPTEPASAENTDEVKKEQKETK